MFDIRHQEQRISELKKRLSQERSTATRQLRTLVPQARRAAVIGSFAWGARKALPLIQPIALGLISKGASVGSSRYLVKALGVATAAFGAWRLLRAARAATDTGADSNGN